MVRVCGITLENADYSSQFEKVIISSWCSLAEQRKCPNLCDVLIKCGSKEYYSHKSVLSVFSPYFRSLFVSDFPRASVDGRTVCNLSDFPPTCIELMLHLMYRELRFEEVEVDYMDLLALFDFIQCNSFDDILTDLVRKTIDIENCCQYLQLVTAFRNEKLRQLTLIFILENFDVVVKTSKFRQLPLQIMKDSLESPILQHICYGSIMHGLKIWSGRQVNTIEEDIMEVVAKHWEDKGSGANEKDSLSLRRRRNDTNLGAMQDSSAKGNLLLAYHPMNEPGKINHILYDSNDFENLTPQSPVLELLTVVMVHGYPASIDEIHFEFKRGQLHAIVTLTNRTSLEQHLIYTTYEQCLRSFTVKFEHIFTKEETHSDDDYKPLKIVGCQFSKGNVYVCVHSNDSCSIISISLSSFTLTQSIYLIPDIPYDDDVFFVSLRENQTILLCKEEIAVFNLKTGSFTKHRLERISYMAPKYAVYKGRLYRFIHGFGLYCFDARRKDWDLLANLTRYAVDYNRFPLIVLKNKLWLPMGSRTQARYVVYFSYDFEKNCVGQCFVFKNIDLFTPKLMVLPDHIVL